MKLSLQLIFFSKQPFYGNYSTLRFSHKHCNFSSVCLLVKMASKTVTRSILDTVTITQFKRRISHVPNLIRAVIESATEGVFLSANAKTDF